MPDQLPQNEWEETGNLLLYTQRNAEAVKAWRTEQKLQLGVLATEATLLPMYTKSEV